MSVSRRDPHKARRRRDRIRRARQNQRSTELAALEEHILACGSCAERADDAQDYVDAIRIAALDFVDPFEGRPNHRIRAQAGRHRAGCNESP